MHAIRRILSCTCLAAALAPLPGLAAGADKDKGKAADVAPPPQAENVRLDYAQVLNVEPVYETVRAKRTSVVCEDAPKAARSAAAGSAKVGEDESRWSKAWHGFKGWFGGDEPAAKLATATEPKPRCRSVPEDVEFRQPIAYDVDYMYKGMKFRARLPEDPGNRLRIRLSVMPYGISSQALDSRN